MNIQTIKIDSNNYPKLLKNIHNPPKVLYVKGNAKLLYEPALAIVGSRHVSAYGQKYTKIFSSSLAKAGLVIISGLAYGVDSWAHQAALENGKTIAVLAGGLEQNLMTWQQKISQEILSKGGTLISEFPPLMPALKHHFPLRNRIIAGLSLGTLVTEAREKSGALITAKAALEEGRLIFALPGDLNRPTAQGSLSLLKRGALLVSEPKDIISDLKNQLSFKGWRELEKNICNSMQKKILAEISTGSLTFEEIVKSVKRAPGQVLSALSELELEGLISRKKSGAYSVNS